MVRLSCTGLSMKNSWFGFLVIAVAMLLTVTGNASQPVKIALGGEPETLDPHLYNLRLEETVLNDLFMGLTTFNAAGDIVPGVATHWETSADGLTWTFYLDKNARWSDGAPLTAADFVFAYRRLQNPQTAASLAYFMYMLKNAAAVNSGQLQPDALGVRAVDPHTLELALEKPYPFLLERLLYPTAFPVPEHMVREHGADWVKAANWVSNGAYMLAEWTPQAHIKLNANPHFSRQPAIQAVVYQRVTNEQSAYNRFRNGELDVIGSFPVGELAKLLADGSPSLRQSDQLSMMYLVFNTESGQLADVRVRQALSLAVDQEILTGKVLRSGNVAQHAFTPSQLSGYQGVALPHAQQTYDARIESARTLLTEAGFTPSNPLKITLRHIGVIENKKVNLAIAGMWRRIGVVTQLQQTDIRGHFADLRQGNFEVAWAGWVGENNAEHYLSLLMSDIGSVNYGRFANETYDALMRQAQNQADTQSRNALLKAAEEVALHYYPVVPLYSNSIRRLVNPALKGWVENPRDMHHSRFLSW